MHEFLFDDEGNLRELVAHELPFVIEERGFGWRSKAVELHYADEHGKKTSGSYPATWMDQ
jgi:transcription initiation factor IIF auxiliary subunit